VTVEPVAQPPHPRKTAMIHSPDLTRGPRRLDEFDVGELEAFIQRGRTLQARAMGRGLGAVFRALFFNQEPAEARTERGDVDWERLLGLGDGKRPADGT
jgi:hypothetical protein